MVSRVDRSTTNVQDRSEFKGVVDQFRKLHLNCKQIGILSCPIFSCIGVPVYFPSCPTRLLSRGSPLEARCRILPFSQLPPLPRFRLPTRQDVRAQQSGRSEERETRQSGSCGSR